MPRTAPTLILYVRHGTTTTTGKVLPGRAPGLHPQAQSASPRPTPSQPESRALLKKVDAIYCSPLERGAGDGGTHRQRGVGMCAKAERGLIECDFGSWTGGSLKDLARKPEWQTVQRYPSGFRFPEGESFVEMSARIRGHGGEVASGAIRAAWSSVVSTQTRSRPRSPTLGTHLDLFQRIVISTCSVTAILYGPAAGKATVNHTRRPRRTGRHERASSRSSSSTSTWSPSA